MKIIFSKFPFLSLLFALAVSVFWAVPYVCALSFQEQYQLFLFTTDYFVERMSVPGGMADYIAEFVTQFNYAYVVGAVLLGTVFFMMRELTVAIFKRVGADEVWQSITFVPAFVLWAYMGNENVMLSFGVSLVAALTFMLFYLKMGGEGLPTVIFTAIGLPAFYWLFGASVWCMVLFAVLFSEGCVDCGGDGGLHLYYYIRMLAVVALYEISAVLWSELFPLSGRDSHNAVCRDGCICCYSGDWDVVANTCWQAEDSHACASVRYCSCRCGGRSGQFRQIEIRPD